MRADLLTLGAVGALALAGARGSRAIVRRGRFTEWTEPEELEIYVHRLMTFMADRRSGGIDWQDDGHWSLIVDLPRHQALAELAFGVSGPLTSEVACFWLYEKAGPDDDDPLYNEDIGMALRLKGASISGEGWIFTGDMERDASLLAHHMRNMLEEAERYFAEQGHAR